MEQQTIEGASTSDAVGFITVVQSLKRKLKNWEKNVEVWIFSFPLSHTEIAVSEAPNMYMYPSYLYSTCMYTWFITNLIYPDCHITFFLNQIMAKKEIEYWGGMKRLAI